jgi:Flp pilus assembly protein TadD
MDVDAYLEEGDRLLAESNRRDALVNYLEARRIAPDDERPLLRLGHYYLNEDDEQAAAIFAGVIAGRPGVAEAHTGLGLARFAQDRFVEARVAFEAALEIEPDQAGALNALAILHSMAGSADTGLVYAQRAYAASPDDANIVNNLGVAYLRSAEFAQAEQAFRAAILLNPSDAALYNNLGLALGRQQRYDEAAAAFRRYGDEAAVQNNLGYVRHLNGDQESAIRHLEAAYESVSTEERMRVLGNLRAATDDIPAALAE